MWPIVVAAAGGIVGGGILGYAIGIVRGFRLGAFAAMNRDG